MKTAAKVLFIITLVLSILSIISFLPISYVVNTITPQQLVDAANANGQVVTLADAELALQLFKSVIVTAIIITALTIVLQIICIIFIGRVLKSLVLPIIALVLSVIFVNPLSIVASILWIVDTSKAQ